MHIPKKWVYKSPDPIKTDEISKHLEISRAAAAVLVSRGINTPAEAKNFLKPDLNGLFNPFLLPDIELAVERIRKAVDCKEKILVYGDRDVDGITSISIMVRTLKSIGGEPSWYIPCDEGYGLHKEIIDRYAKEGIKLIITVDCGISSFEESAYAEKLGIDVVITDHHEIPPTGMPKAVAIVDPKRPDSIYPFHEIAGCSVAFKVSEALMLSFGRYYNEELLFLSLKPGFGPKGISGALEIGCAKTRNGLAVDNKSFSINGDTAGAKNTLKEFLGFAGTGRIVVHDSEAVLGILEQLLLKHIGQGIKNEVIDTLPLSIKCNYPEIKNIAELASEMKLNAINEKGAVGDALVLSKIFFSLDCMADLRMNFFRDNNLDLVALGTIADIMPMIEENRIFIKRGLMTLAETNKVGVKQLMERYGSKNRDSGSGFSSKAISWNVTPVLNAAGRRGRADLSTELLLTEDPYRAKDLLDEIDKLNSERKELQLENLNKFIPLLVEQCDVENDKIFVVIASGIEHGVTGIIASQIMRRYMRPTILMIIEGGEAMGSARSIEGFDIVTALSGTSDILIKYGGHNQAAGLTLKADNIDEFKRRIKEIAEKEITPEMTIPTIEIDSEIKFKEINMSLLNDLTEMEPYGPGNTYPVFSMSGVQIKAHGVVGNTGDHLKLSIGENGGKGLSSIGWGLGYMNANMEEDSYMDVAFQLEVNVWKDKKNIQLIILDIKPTDI